MDINAAFSNLTREIESIKRQLRQKPNVETGGNWISMGAYQQLPPYSAGTEIPFSLTIPRDMSLRQFRVAAFVVTTNSTSHRWNIQLASTAVSIGTVTTGSISPDTWTPLTLNVGDMTTTDLVASTDVFLRVLVTKTGTPGILYLASPVLYFV